MTEIRPIREAEAATFLSLLCRVFHLDVGRASAIFYSEPFYDLNRKWAFIQNGSMKSILTTTPLDFGWGRAIGIAGVGTDDSARGKGYAETLLREVLSQSEQSGEGPAILFAHKTVLYERVGFEVLDHVVKGAIRVSDPRPWGQGLPLAEVQSRYAEWASQDEARLRRDERRWRYWQFVYRECLDMGRRGYIGCEASLCREAIVEEATHAWPVHHGTEWYGLRSMAKVVGVPLLEEKEELILMGRHFPSLPQMFMSDQF